MPNAKSIKTRKLEAAIEAIKKELELETLATRNRDCLDFHDLSVASIRAAIQIAFDAGLEAGLAIASVR